jgi:FTR1 family protein
LAATLVIFLREGIEASMIVAILCAYLNRVGQRRHFQDVFAGVGAALLLAALGGAAIYFTVREYAGSQMQTVIETATYLLAACVLTYMTFWMRDHSRTISRELRQATDAALGSGARRGLFLLAFQAVGREGLETAVFTLAIIFSTTVKGALTGAAIGLALSLALAFAIYRLGTHINIGVFFRVVGALLMVFAAGLLVDAVENLQELGWLPFLAQPLWDSSRLLSEDSALGDILHSFFGYVSQPTPLEVAVWLVYLGLVLTAFLNFWQEHKNGVQEDHLSRRKVLTVGVPALILVVLALIGTGFAQNAGYLGGTAPPPSTADQERGMVDGMPFTDPPDANSPGDPHPTLTINAKPTQFNLSGKEVWGESYNGSFVGPTLYIQPGHPVDLTLVNQLSTATNLHFHGLNVSPSGNADNVTLSVSPGQSQAYHLDIPTDHPQGTFWYHDHDMCGGASSMAMSGTPAASTATSGSSEASCNDVESQLFAGLAGTIVIGDDRTLLPSDLQTITTHTLALKDVQIDHSNHILQNSGSTSIDSNKPTVRLVNGLLQPVLTIRPGETQLWRLANEGADIFYNLQLNGSHFTVIGEDGYPVAQVTSADTLLLPPGKRYDVLVTAAAQPGNSWLRTLAYSNGPQGDSYPQVDLLNLQVAGQPETPAAMHSGALSGAPADLSNATLAQRRTLMLSESSDGTVMFVNSKPFDMSQSIFNTPAVLGSVEQWTIMNTSGEIHPFHLHIGHFQVMSINGVPKAFTGEQDAIPIPDEQNGVPGQVVIRIAFDADPGQWMFHCHIAAHEDAGMMSFVNVVPATAAVPH